METIEPSITLLEKETDKSYLFNSMKPKKDESKKDTLIIVFSNLGGVILLGGVIGLAFYCKKKSMNIINNTNNTNNSSIEIVNLKH